MQYEPFPASACLDGVAHVMLRRFHMLRACCFPPYYGSIDMYVLQSRLLWPRLPSFPHLEVMCPASTQLAQIPTTWCCRRSNQRRGDIFYMSLVLFRTRQVVTGYRYMGICAGGPWTTNYTRVPPPPSSLPPLRPALQPCLHAPPQRVDAM